MTIAQYQTLGGINMGLINKQQRKMARNEKFVKWAKFRLRLMMITSMVMLMAYGAYTLTTQSETLVWAFLTVAVYNMIKSWVED
ncbi:hypothetical protein BpsS140_00012 [Bacillus phage vB_BpsS-140]|nr:hypothetical protein BpsS140_00012 [Bacillus phage vB_BpsS-140]